MRTEEWQEKAAFIDMLRELTLRLNRYRAAYAAHTPLVSDEIYDILFSDLQTLEPPTCGTLVHRPEVFDWLNIEMEKD